MPIGKVYLVQGFTKVSTNAFLVDVIDDDVINILISSTTSSKIVEALDLIIFNLLILEKVTCICSIKFWKYDDLDQVRGSLVEIISAWNKKLPW